MKKTTLTFTEILNLICFLLFLFASDLAHIEHGSELALWLMAFAIVLTIAAALFPWLGIRWLRMEPKGSRAGRWLAFVIQITSWGTFGYAMILRWRRSLAPFYWWITLTALLWALWLIIFIYSRYAARTGDTLDHENHENN
jgi:Na+/proline symporter